MSVSEQALIDKGDSFLRRAEDGDLDDGHAHYHALMACAYFLRAGILARQEAMARARGESEQLAAAIRSRQAAQQKGPADDHRND